MGGGNPWTQADRCRRHHADCTISYLFAPTGVTGSAFVQLLRFLYADASPSVSAADCCALLALGDRFCLPRLVRLTESVAVSDLASRASARKKNEEGDGNDDDEVAADALRLLQLCQLHGADQLADWCLAYLAQNYDAVCRRFPKALRNLHPENQAWLNLNRWPPVWYIKDYDYHEVRV